MLHAVGYGPLIGQNEFGLKVMPQIFRAKSGSVLELVYGTSDNCYHDFALCGSEVGARLYCDRFDATLLMDGYEIFASGSDADAQTCSGDSGGPLIANTRDGRVVIGVTSWSWHSPSARCLGGTVFAIFGPRSQTLMKKLNLVE